LIVFIPKVCRPSSFSFRAGPLDEVSQSVRIYRETLLRPRGTVEGSSELISPFEQIVQGYLRRADSILANKQPAPRAYLHRCQMLYKICTGDARLTPCRLGVLLVSKCRYASQLQHSGWPRTDVDKPTSLLRLISGAVDASKHISGHASFARSGEVDQQSRPRRKYT
jgi:hypothetical protein